MIRLELWLARLRRISFVFEIETTTFFCSRDAALFPTPPRLLPVVVSPA